MAKIVHSPYWSLRNVRADAYRKLSYTSPSHAGNWFSFPEMSSRSTIVTLRYRNVTACFMFHGKILVSEISRSRTGLVDRRRPPVIGGVWVEAETLSCPYGYGAKTSTRTGHILGFTIIHTVSSLLSFWTSATLEQHLTSNSLHLYCTVGHTRVRPQYHELYTAR